MSHVIYHLFFLIVSLFILAKAIGYGLYEINTFKNKYGGIVVIIFSIFVVIFSNAMVWWHF